jgi:hypothetical protein
MTLKEKLFNPIFDNLWEHTEENIIPEVEKIADEFAIGFAKWLEINKQDVNYSKNHNTEELLGIYKKQQNDTKRKV